MRVLPAGPAALLVEWGGPDAPDRVRAFYAEAVRRRSAGLLEVLDVVPAARTVLLEGLADPAALALELPGWSAPPVPTGAGPLVEIPVVYDGADLAEVARRWRTAPEEVAAVHSGLDYRVAFCGFAPGFGYLTGLPERLHVPRRPTPRTEVPAGSVGVAGEFTGVYPRASPGGWQLLGRTDLVLFDPVRDPAALLAPGTRVRFVPVAGG